MKPLDVDKALSAIPMPVTLIGSSWEGKDNVMTASWLAPSASSPPLVSIYIGNQQFTRELISHSGEFVVNVLASDQVEISEICGSVSGREVDKYAKAGMRTRRAQKVNVPLIEGCLTNLECKVVAQYEAGDHTLFVGEIVAAHQGDARSPLTYFDGKYADVILRPSS